MWQSLGKLNSAFDVAVIGAGINGATAARELAAAGYSVLLVDKGDFASGATSRSGRILHCGLRFMAPEKRVSEYFLKPRTLLMKLLTAKRMAEEHGELYQTIPERLRPMELALPIYDHFGYSGWHVDIGAKLINLFNGGKSPIHYTRHKRTSSLHPFVKLLRDKEKVNSVISFVDQQFYWPERIAVDAALDAQDLGATIRNYTQVSEIAREGESWRIRLRDTLEPEDTAEVSASMVVNLAGAWVDDVIAKISTNASPSRKIRGTKGVHFLLKLPDELRGYGIVGENREGEHIFCLPWGRLHYFGPTETVFEGDLDEVVPDEADVSFILEEASHLLPSLRLRRKDIVLAWAGVRPITYDPERPKGKRLPFSILHDLEEEGLPNMLAMTWGTIVNHRSAARDIAGFVARKVQPSGSPRKLVLKARDMPDIAGDMCSEALARMTPADIRHFVEREHARSLADILCRRTALFWNGAVTDGGIRRVAEQLGELLDWDERRVQSELDLFSERLHREHLYSLSR